MSEPAALTPEEGRLPLESAFNLRDFGGYATADGRCVKRGMLYRSGTMALLTDGDADHLRSLGIRAICDFRRGNERTAEPTLWHGADVDYFCRDYTESSGLLGEMLQREGATADDMRRTMIALYRMIPVDHAASYRAMFERITDGRVPLLINCSAGKDRTGVGAALILAALGVPRPTIVQDYLATNAHADWDWLLAQRDTLVARMRLAGADMLEPLLRAEAAYLDSFFAALDESHGGVDGYLNGMLGVDAAARDAMRGMLLD
ncbi:tyrosine-protein phosphatase [Sphingobium indicum]|uniref:Protein tyrosine phosphatase n=2 Tax=Sphingobium indicum TaxID=332055 RepID=A0A1L5BSB6_SPHIB|nr:tyrosine-protein phosphatase [Sphingobium indicum]APL95756.1 protein tyrosine phosphatase [Sphingobium indicum B90A]KEY97050.1 protein tyrosine phosphatase [Sphingomonas sp. BHC-A]NYI23909.1 protein-tyrosine phosphatase [Sphingobium indicum]RYM00062.1 tyrosine-protein phosphatase [Sphingobium indicum]